jgi:hypothetical protein
MKEAKMHMDTNKKKMWGALLFLAASLAPIGAQAAGPDDEARALVQQFVKAGADVAALTAKLRPTKADYAAVFDAAAAAKAQAAYDAAWDQGAMVLKGKPGQTAVLIWGASSEELKSWTGAAAQHFPGGWKDGASHLQPGLRFYAFKFVEPGQTLGMAFDGLVKVNGQWRIFPKAWKIVQ